MSLKNAVGGSALIAGTAIGAAILALPIATAHLGFIQTMILYLVCWFFMTIGALYLLEVNLLVGYGTNLISMSEKTLGSTAKYATWLIYLLLLYSLVSLYFSGASVWINQAFHFYNWSIHPAYSAFVAALFTLFVILLGTSVVDWVNRALMIGLMGAFCALIFMSSSHIDLNLLFLQPQSFDLLPIPLIITGFGFAIIVPSLTEYLHGNARQLFYVVSLGSLVPLFIYFVWEIIIVGIIPMHGSPSLIEIQQSGHPVTDVPKALKILLRTPKITTAAQYFSIFALTTSLLGVTLSLFDFLADGLKLKKNFKGKIVLSTITFLPPFILVSFFPNCFIFMLSFAGIFVALLLGVLPSLMVWGERVRLKATSPLQVPGGKALIFLTILFFLGVVVIECYQLII